MKMELKKEDVLKLAEDDKELELCQMVTQEIAEQFTAFLDNYQKMINQYPLVRATVCFVAQLRIMGKEASTSVTGRASEVRKCMLSLMQNLAKDDE